MKNIHLEHPEDAILNCGEKGASAVLKFLKQENSNFSLKWDGSPAIVWGKNPENGKFFVGTKSVFNKVKIKINHSHEEIDINHEGQVAEILHHAFDCLPHIDFIVQGDFIGYGETDKYCPNTIEYRFPTIVKQKFIIAPHTVYSGKSLKECKVIDNTCLYWKLLHSDKDHKCKFLSCYAHSSSGFSRINILCDIASMVIPFVEFPDEKQGKEIKKIINSYIREGKKISTRKLAKETNAPWLLFVLYKIIIMIKNVLLKSMNPHENVLCFTNKEECSHEGYVMVNKYGMYKLVNRLQFSYANFNSQKNWEK